ncbi:hypothetical protein FNZ56_10040 [Pseudoluteimonas lycopersici]|uniref:DUF805 domain-containing protein n=1 Tax=Pseudoluteimonas lycopersici TaxID=1324796 RepID=A0A516V6Q2_9GAMM|nr:hypothetical protein [Lysobacter lycopersici]QDQ74195.1 hypothetical protein FNZ56_10040 [Lysobacter lycopersici]
MTKALAITSLVTLVILTAYQQKTGTSFSATDSTPTGSVLGAMFLIPSLLAWFGAMMKAHSLDQKGWLLAIILLWPAMYPYLLHYAKPDPY